MANKERRIPNFTETSPIKRITPPASGADLPAVNPLPTLDAFFSQYCFAREQFFTSEPQVAHLFSTISEIEDRLEALTKNQSEAMAAYDSTLHYLSLKRRGADSEENRVWTSYHHAQERRVLKARAYDFLVSLHLAGIAERLYPLQTTWNLRNKVRGEVAVTEKARTQTERRLLEGRKSLEDWEKEARIELRKKTEDWVLADRTYVLMYAVEHPERAVLIFRRYAMPSADPQAVWQSLAQDYASSTGRVLEFPQTVLPSDRPVLEQGRIPVEIPTKQESTQKPEAKPKLYKVGVIQKVEIHNKLVNSIRELNEEEISEYLAKQAEKIAGHDNRMTEDVRAIVTNLRQGPHGFGTKRITRHGSETVRYKPLYWHEFDPRQRSGLKYGHPESRKLRVVYGLCENGEEGEPVIVLKEILRHKEFDLRFGHGRTR